MNWGSDFLGKRYERKITYLYWIDERWSRFPSENIFRDTCVATHIIPWKIWYKQITATQGLKWKECNGISWYSSSNLFCMGGGNVNKEMMRAFWKDYFVLIKQVNRPNRKKYIHKVIRKIQYSMVVHKPRSKWSIVVRKWGIVEGATF